MTDSKSVACLNPGLVSKMNTAESRYENDEESVANNRPIEPLIFFTPSLRLTASAPPCRRSNIRGLLGRTGSSVADLISHADPAGERTIFVLTKIDVAERMNKPLSQVRLMYVGRKLRVFPLDPPGLAARVCSTLPLHSRTRFPSLILVLCLGHSTFQSCSFP